MSSTPLAPAEGCCLITGGAGNLAAWTAWAIEKRFQRLILTDIVPAPAGPIPPNAIYEQMDIGDFPKIERLVQTHRPNAIIHLASLLSGSSEKDRRKTWHINTTATLEILEQALRLHNCRVLFASTLATYGGDLPKFITEDQPQWPTTLYGATKIACERLGAYFREAHDLDFRCVRLPIILSPHAPPQAVSAMVSRAFVESKESGRFIFRARAEMKVASLYVKDVISGLVDLLLAPGEKVRQPVYNIAGYTATLGEFSEAIKKRLPKVEHRFEPDADVERVLAGWPVALDDSNARRDWGWKHRFDLDATAADFLGASS
jgi:threonine 3-dehydrogenase